MEGLDTKTTIGIGLCVVLCIAAGWAFKKSSSAETECELLKKAVEDLGNIINQQDQHIRMLTARLAQVETLVGSQPMAPPMAQSAPQNIPQSHTTAAQNMHQRMRTQPQKPAPKPVPKPKQQTKPIPRDLPQVEEVEEEEIEEPGEEFDEQLRSELEKDVCDVNGNCGPKKKRA